MSASLFDSPKISRPPPWYHLCYFPQAVREQYLVYIITTCFYTWRSVLTARFWGVTENWYHLFYFPQAVREQYLVYIITTCFCTWRSVLPARFWGVTEKPKTLCRLRNAWRRPFSTKTYKGWSRYVTCGCIYMTMCRSNSIQAQTFCNKNVYFKFFKLLLYPTGSYILDTTCLSLLVRGQFTEESSAVFIRQWLINNKCHYKHRTVQLVA